MSFRYHTMKQLVLRKDRHRFQQPLFVLNRIVNRISYQRYLMKRFHLCCKPNDSFEAAFIAALIPSTVTSPLTTAVRIVVEPVELELSELSR